MSYRAFESCAGACSNYDIRWVLLHMVLVWKSMGLLFCMSQGVLRKVISPKTEFLKIITIFLQEKPIFLKFGDINFY